MRVEDDGNDIESNRFSSDLSTDQAVVIGTQLRTQVLGLPVTGTTVRNNGADIVANPSPFVWAWGQVATTDQGNTSNGAPSTVVEGTAPPLGPFLFVVRVWL